MTQEQSEWERSGAEESEGVRGRKRRTASESERERQDYAYYGNPWASGATQSGREAERLSYAVIRSSMQLVVGVTETVGNFLLNLDDSLWGRHMETPRHRRASEPAYHFRRSEGSRAETSATRTSDIISDMADNLVEVVRDSAEVLSRAAENFSRVYEEDRDRYGYSAANPQQESGKSSNA